MKENKNSKQAVRLPLFIGAAMALGIFIGAQMADSGGDKPELFKSIYKLRQVISYIENDYVDEVDTEELVEGLIENMLVKLDPHTIYIPKEQMERTQSELRGNFEGIGIQFSIIKDTINVIAALSGGPSEKLGIRSGDRIIKVNGENVAGIGITTTDVMDKLMGPKGTEVNVTVMRKSGDNLTIEYTIERDVIPVSSVDVAYMIDEEIGYIKASRFTATTYMEFKEALNVLQQKGMQKLVLDLTNNPGGIMSVCIDMADEFLAGKQLIVYTQGKESRYNENHISRIKGDFEEDPLIILINEGSASASEIVAGAVQDHDRGLIVGRRSFGKGLVQVGMGLNDGSQLRLTISRYYTPSGRCIQKSYNGDIAEYRRENYERFQNGEIFHRDSIVVNDSLAFTTDKGRTVYGGGGIIPDYFVPYDTSGNSRYLNQLFTSNTIAEYVLGLTDEEIRPLEELGMSAFLESFEVDDNTVQKVIEVASRNGVSFNGEQFESSEDKIKLYLKAYLGRRIWGSQGFYPVLNQDNEILLKALELFDEAEKLARTNPN